MEDKSLKLTIKLGPICFEAEGHEASVISERNAFLDFVDRHSNAPFLSEINTTAKQGDASLLPASASDSLLINPTAGNYSSFVDFKNSIKLSGNTDMVMGCAFYLQHYERYDCFTTRDIKELLQKSRIKSRINIAQFVTQNIKKGYIEEVTDHHNDKKLKAYCILDKANKWFDKVSAGAGCDVEQ